MIQIIPATLDHIKALYGEPPARTVRAFAAIENDRVLGVSGVYWDGENNVVFSKLTDELRNNKRALIKGIRKIKTLLGNKAFAICDPSIDKAPQFLRHIGFKHLKNEVYLWTA